MRNRVLNKCLLLLIAALSLFNGASAFAYAQSFNAGSDRIIASIAAGKQNRIEFENSKILEVIGNSSQYSIVPSISGRYIFLVPNLSGNKKLEISIVYGSNEVQELTLLVGDITGQSIVIKPAGETKTLKQTKPVNSSKELAELIRHMRLDKVGKYNVTELNNKLPELTAKSIKLTFDKKYGLGSPKLIGRRLKIKNSGREPLALREEVFSHIFENIIAVTLSKGLLHPREEGYVFLVSKAIEGNSL